MAPGGEVTYYAYDPLSRLDHVRADALDTDAVTYYDYDPVGNTTRILDAEAHATYFAYDALTASAPRPTPSATDPAQGGFCPERELHWHRSFGSHTRGVRCWLFGVRGVAPSARAPNTHHLTPKTVPCPSPNATVTYHVYAAAGRITSLADRRSDGTAISTFQFTRDPNGNILTSLRDASGVGCSVLGAGGVPTRPPNTCHLTPKTIPCPSPSATKATAYPSPGRAPAPPPRRTHIVENGVPTYYQHNPANELTRIGWVDGWMIGWLEFGAWAGSRLAERDASAHSAHSSIHPCHPFIQQASNAQNLITRIDSTEAGFTPNVFAYNALGQRIRITDSTGTTYYVWDGIRITHEHDGAGSLTKRYTYGHSPIIGVSDLLDLHDLSAPSTPHYFYHFDQVGGVRALSDGYEGVGQAYEVCPFGEMLTRSGSVANPFVFPATYLRLPDADGGALSPSRLYNTRVGRFLQRDRAPQPTGLGASPYLFVYDPLRVVDPTGEVKIARHNWVIERENTKPTATAKPLPNTRPFFGMLALVLRLEPSELSKWIAPLPPAKQPTNQTEEPSPCGYAVPNTIYSLWAGHMGAFGRAWTRYGRMKAALRTKGYLVLELRNIAASSMGADMRLLTMFKVLHGVLLFGHAGGTLALRSPKGHLVTVPTPGGKPRVRLKYIGGIVTNEAAARPWPFPSIPDSPYGYTYAKWERDLAYRLAYLRLNACMTEEANPRYGLWRIGSDTSEFTGFSGALCPLPAGVRFDAKWLGPEGLTKKEIQLIRASEGLPK